MSWNNVCVEGFCSGEEDENEKYPCGQKYPISFCLGNFDSGICPLFGFAESSEREAAKFVPFRLIIWDRVNNWLENLGWNIRWIFWDWSWFNQRKTKKFFESIPIVTSEDSDVLADYEREMEENKLVFEKWIIKARSEENNEL